MASKIWKAAALWLVISVVVWLTTIWRWQSADHDASTGDIVGQLFVLPVALTAALLLVLWMVQRMRAATAAPGAAAGSPAAATPVPQPSADEAARAWSAWVLAEAVNIAVGADAASAIQGVRSRSMRPSLDAELQDLDGLPVTTVRAPELDAQAWAEMHGLSDAVTLGELSPSVVRALALLASPLTACLSTLDALVPAFQGLQGSGGAAHGGDDAGMSMKAHLSGVAKPVPTSVRAAREAMAPSLSVRLLMPPHWSAATRDKALDCIRGQCGALLDWAQAVNAKGVQWSVEPLAQPENLWDELDQRIVQWARQERPELLLVLALDSALDEQQIDRWQAHGDLFTASHQTGRIPGEGAAAVLLASQHCPGLDLLESDPVRMWRPARARRDKSADAAGRVGMATLSQLLTRVLDLTGATQDGLSLVSDADHRASRTAELFEALQEAAPGLDPMLTVTRVGEACGDIGLAGVLVPPALASAAVRAAAGSGNAKSVALVALVQSSQEGVVLALSPRESPGAATT